MIKSAEGQSVGPEISDDLKKIMELGRLLLVISIVFGRIIY